MNATAPRRRPLHVLLSVLFSALVLAAGSAIAWLGYLEGRAVALASADQSFGHIARETQSSLDEALQPVRRFVGVLALAPVARSHSTTTRAESLASMVTAFSDDAPVAAVYVGYEDGGFFLVRPLRDDAARKAFEAPAGALWLSETIEAGPGGVRHERFAFYDAALR